MPRTFLTCGAEVPRSLFNVETTLATLRNNRSRNEPENTVSHNYIRRKKKGNAHGITGGIHVAISFIRSKFQNAGNQSRIVVVRAKKESYKLQLYIFIKSW